MPASATAMIVRRAGTLATRRVRAAIGHLLAVRHAVTMVKSVRSSRAKIVAVARSARSSRAATVRISIATTVRRAGSRDPGIATMRVRRDVLPTGNLATGSPIPRAKVAARSGPIRRVAKVFAKTATVRVAIGPLAPGRRAMAIVPVVIGLRENLAVTRSSRAVRPIEARARILVTSDRGRDRGNSKPWQKREDRGERDSRPARDGARNFDKPRFDRSRDDRGGEERPRFSRSREDRPKFDRPRETTGRPHRLAGASAQRSG